MATFGYYTDRVTLEALARQIPIRCFSHDPSVSSSLKFLLKTPWARDKVAPYRAQINYLKDAIEDSEVLNGLLLQRKLSVGAVDSFQAIQSSSFKPATRLKCLVLWVTKGRPSAKACAAIWVSISPMGCPVCCRWAAMPP